MTAASLNVSSCSHNKLLEIYHMVHVDRVLKTQITSLIQPTVNVSELGLAYA